MFENTIKYVRSLLPESPAAAVVLGSGLSNFSENLSGTIKIPYSEIAGYPLPTVQGHVGELAFGYIGDVPVICARGRFHYYEGHPIEIVTLPIRLFNGVGCGSVIITNAAGCVRRDWQLGNLMLINGHIDFTFRNSKADPEICSGKGYYDPGLMALARKSAENFQLPLREGCYCWTPGPTYETPAEILKIRELGGDAVGMSTVPEIEMAHELGLPAMGISCLTNYAAGITDQPLSHAEVLETTELAKKSFAQLVMGVLKTL